MKAKQRAKGLPMFPGAIKTYAILSFLIIVEGICIIAQAFYLAKAITSLFQGEPIFEITLEIGLFFVAFMLRYIVVHIEERFAQRFARLTVKQLRQKILKKYMYDDQHLRRRLGTAHLVTLAVDGIDDLKKYIEMIGIRMLKTVIVPIFIVLFVFYFDITAAVILIVTVPIVIIFMILLGMAAEKQADRQYETYTQLANHFIDSLKGLETLMYLGKSKSHAKSISKVSEAYQKETMKTLRVAFLSSFALDFFTSLSIAFIAVSLGFRLIDGHMMLLPALTILILAPEYFAPIKQVGKDYHATLDGQIALHQIKTLLTEEVTQPKSSIFIKHIQSIECSNIKVRVNERDLLKHISFHLSKNHRWLGVIGPSGAGKSTLIHLLAGRLLHDGGTIKINNKEVHSLQQEFWYENIAYIPQHPYIFPLSLADNIRFYQPDATDEQVRKVIKKMGLKDLVKTLPKGIHESIGEGGHALSGGQEQRIALARALLSDQPIILLDEPTAHLDIETEYDIKQLMKTLFADKFVVIVTHRMHWLNEVDEVLLLEKGQITAKGNPLKLLQSNGKFTSFVKRKRGILI